MKQHDDFKEQNTKLSFTCSYQSTWSSRLVLAWHPKIKKVFWNQHPKLEWFLSCKKKIVKRNISTNKYSWKFRRLVCFSIEETICCHLFDKIFSVLVEARVLILGHLVQLEVVLQPVVAVRIQVVGVNPEIF